MAGTFVPAIVLLPTGLKAGYDKKRGESGFILPLRQRKGRRCETGSALDTAGAVAVHQRQHLIEADKVIIILDGVLEA